MLEYLTATLDDKEDIVDFINYVFSQSRKPHDFRSLMPKSYADDVTDLGATHYLVKKDNKIKAVVANRIIDIAVGNSTLKFGLIGNVAVHPYSRGEGYMKKLMQTAISEAKDNGIDILVLAGQRQRYGYFGFENAGATLHFIVSKDNLRHCFSELNCSDITFKPLAEANDDEINTAIALYEKRPYHTLRNRDEYCNIMCTWNAECRIIYKKGKMIGYSYSSFSELILENESDFPLVLKAMFEQDKLCEVDIPVAPFEKERASFLASICENSNIQPLEMINVLCWENVLKVLFDFKAKVSTLLDGDLEIQIDSEVFSISIKNGTSIVEKLDTSSKNAVRLTHSEAIQKFFSLNSLLLPDERFKNWAPLPFLIDAPDSY